MQDTVASPYRSFAPAAPPPGANEDWTVPQDWESLTEEAHWVWDTLFAHRREQLRGRAVSAFEEGVAALELDRPGIPDFEALNLRLKALSGWTVVPVPGIVPDDVFFRHLSERRFPTGNFIRKPQELDFCELPDLFHDVFGHVTMLARPEIARFLQTMGRMGLEALELGALHRIARLYWYTMEVGLAREGGSLRIYGAAILSSSGEAFEALEKEGAQRLDFDIERIMRTAYNPLSLQKRYFVIDRFEDILVLNDFHDLPELYARLERLPDLTNG